MTDRPDVRADGCVEVLEADGVRAWHHEKMAGCDGAPVHEDHNVLVLVDEACFRSAGDDGAEDALLLRRPVGFAHGTHTVKPRARGPDPVLDSLDELSPPGPVHRRSRPTPP